MIGFDDGHGSLQGCCRRRWGCRIAFCCCGIGQSGGGIGSLEGTTTTGSSWVAADADANAKELLSFCCRCSSRATTTTNLKTDHRCALGVAVVVVDAA